jgi:SagB-type dehydrogenase family enzyme
LWREYHDATKHSRESLRRSRHFLDWANMPDPFRHYEGVPVRDLPADPLAPPFPCADGAAFLSQLLYYSAAISASKVVPSTGARYALRVNPSSGNLHPSEFHFATRGLEHWPDGLYHYRPSSHMAEQRALGDYSDAVHQRAAPVTFYLTSIAWREAWKYQSRAYRYCLHDIGHAWQSLALAAEAMGCVTFARGRFPDDDLATSLGCSDDEWPMLVVELRGEAIPVQSGGVVQSAWFGGTANILSPEQVSYPLIDQVHAATKANDTTPGPFVVELARGGAIQLPGFGEIVRQRRSALDFIGGERKISLPQLSALLAATASPLSADFADRRFVRLYLYVHRVEGLAPGVYRYWPQSSQLEQVLAGDQRVAAAGLSLGQDLAGNACIAFSMIADLELATALHGERGYRYAHFEAGAIGHRFYLAAESLGLGATGIGAFFDDEVNRYLGLTPEQGQVIYHFAIGYPVPDTRLQA